MLDQSSIFSDKGYLSCSIFTCRSMDVIRGKSLVARTNSFQEFGKSNFERMVLMSTRSHKYLCLRSNNNNSGNAKRSSSHTNRSYGQTWIRPEMYEVYLKKCVQEENGLYICITTMLDDKGIMIQWWKRVEKMLWGKNPLAVITRDNAITAVFRGTKVAIRRVLAAADTEFFSIRLDKIDPVAPSIASAANFVLYNIHFHEQLKDGVYCR